MIKIISWNLHYDLTDEKKQHIKELQTQYEPDILILQECTPKGFDLLKNEWKYSVIYADTLYENKANYGVAVFSNSYELRFTENFNRNFRYVLPFEIWKEKEIQFYLFAVWTKKEPIAYSKNVLDALNFEGYKNYVSDKAVFIGDFNIPATKEKRGEYDLFAEAGLIDCADSGDILKPTYSHLETVSYYTADYCFATSKMKETFKIAETILDLDDSISVKDKYIGLSDHVPLVIEISK